MQQYDQRQRPPPRCHTPRGRGMATVLFALGTAFLPLLLIAQVAKDVTADHWLTSEPTLLITVTPATTPRAYLVTGLITDARTNKVLANPVLETPAGESASSEISLKQAGRTMAVRFTVRVRPNGKSADYSGEAVRNGKLLAEYDGTVSVAR